MSAITRKIVLAAAIVGTLGALVVAQTPQKTVTPDQVKWPSGGSASVGTSLVSGVQTVILKGDPAKAGLYTILLRAAPNTKIQAHSHPDDRVATVVSGTWYFAYGREFDEKTLKTLPAGSFYTEPPGVPHFAMTKGEVVIQITGTGPSGTTYVDERNDPTKK